jgi:hypothetical protein
MDVIESLRRLLRVELTIAEWIGTAAIVLAPYLVLGVAYAATHVSRFGGLDGLRVVIAVAGSVLAWPLLLFIDACAV